MATPALLALVNTIVDAGVDTVKALQPGQSVAQRFAQYENLVADAVADVSSIGDLANEAKALAWQDYLSLSGAAVVRCGFASAKAQAVVSAVLKAIGDLATGSVVPDVLAIISAIKG